MINFLHSNLPNPILISLGPIQIYWYGLFIVIGILTAILICFKLGEYYKISKDTIIDSAFYLILFGIIGARTYDVLLELPYYLKNPLDIFKIWQGGLAIHGAIIAGLIVSWFFARKNKINFWLLIAIYAPALAFAQAIGRWGNYFNQELFGKPTTLPWGIPINPINRIAEYYNYRYFHPTFLYESLGSLIIFFILVGLHAKIIKTKSQNYDLIVTAYLILYSLLRFSLEFVRIDTTPMVMGWRLPQIVSLLVIAACFIYIGKKYKSKNISKPAEKSTNI